MALLRGKALPLLDPPEPPETHEPPPDDVREPARLNGPAGANMLGRCVGSVLDREIGLAVLLLAGGFDAKLGSFKPALATSPSPPRADPSAPSRMTLSSLDDSRNGPILSAIGEPDPLVGGDDGGATPCLFDRGGRGAAGADGAVGDVLEAAVWPDGDALAAAAPIGDGLAGISRMEPVRATIASGHNS